MIEKVEMYKTEDGSLFEDLQEAELYQRKLQSNSDFLERLSSIIFDKQMLEWILDELKGVD